MCFHTVLFKVFMCISYFLKFLIESSSIYETLGENRCQLEANQTTLVCDKTLDIVLLIDGSGSLGRKGWAAEIKAAQLFVDAFCFCCC